MIRLEKTVLVCSQFSSTKAIFVISLRSYQGLLEISRPYFRHLILLYVKDSLLMVSCKFEAMTKYFFPCFSIFLMPYAQYACTHSRVKFFFHKSNHYSTAPRCRDYFITLATSSRFPSRRDLVWNSLNWCSADYVENHLNIRSRKERISAFIKKHTETRLNLLLFYTLTAQLTLKFNEMHHSKE